MAKVYAKKVQTTEPRFKDRAITVSSSRDSSKISVPDTVILCNGCNSNIYPEAGYLIYLSKQELKKDQPYDFYCESCKNKYFRDAKNV